ncbi:hypothetical protein NSQ62_07670 [Solibacillus sp. FSL H8-0523]|uniref:hypothetical protein n=1 Tax=Solibacillus sp. FSL H8-0523 TaxID=2954511 RepID=UPI0031016C71
MKVSIDVISVQATTPSEIEVNVDTVYVRSNIRRVELTNGRNNQTLEVWQYDEAQYELKEFQELIAHKVNENKSEIMDSLGYSVDLDLRLAMIEMGMV